MTRYDPEIHHRRSIRLDGYDYSQAGAYFVTICVRDRAPILGTVVVDDRVEHTDCGRAVAYCWQWLPTRYSHVALDEWIVMPDHVHGIVVICHSDAGGFGTAPARRKPLGQIVGAFKTVSTQRVNRLRGCVVEPLWQRDFTHHPQ